MITIQTANFPEDNHSLGSVSKVKLRNESFVDFEDMWVE